MVAFEKNLQWRELFDLAVVGDISEEDLKDIAYRISEDLSSKKRYTDAAQVLLEYAKDVRGAVNALVQGNAFSEAKRIVRSISLTLPSLSTNALGIQSNLHKQPELVEEIVRPGTLDARTQIAEDITEMREQIRKQRNRIRELRIRKVEEPGTCSLAHPSSEMTDFVHLRCILW